MSTSPTFNTVTARTIDLNNPGQMSAAGTVIARDFTATGNIVANNGAARRASFSQVTATGNVTGANFITLGVVNAVTQIRSSQIIANNSMSIGSTTTIQNSGVTTANLIATGNVTGNNLFTAGRVSAAGNVSGNYILGNGYFLTGLAGGGGTYGNSNVAQYLPTYTGALTGGNLTVGSSTLINNNLSLQNIVAAANITAGRINSGTLSLTGNVLSPLTVSGNVIGTNLNTTGQMSATGNVQGGNLRTVGTVSATGNITGNYIFGNGAFLTGVANGGGSDYGNANVAAYLPTYAGTLNPASLSTTGAVTAASLQIGTSTLTANSLSVPLDVVAGRNVTGSGLRGATLSLTGNVISALNVSANMAAVNVNTTGQMSATGNVQGGNVLAIGTVSAIGNITGNYIFGNGAFLTGIANGGGGSTYGNANVAAYLPTYTGTLTGANLIIGTSTLTANSLSVPLDVVAGRNINGANLFGTIRTASQTGITQVGTLGTLAVAGEIQAGSMALSGALSATGTITGTTITGTGLSVSGSGIIGTVQILNSAITGAASVTATGNVSGGALRSSGIVSAVGAITGASVSASGNVTGLNILGNGYSLSNILRSNQARTVWVSNASPSSLSGASGDIWYQTYS